MAKYLLSFILFLLVAIDCISSADDWWEYGHFYQIYPRSFQDSDGDGIGDLNGITARLEYFKEIGITGVWLSPIFLSPMKDFGYDISDFRAIQPEYGTMDDFKRMVKRCKELDIKIILDFVPNHASDQHEWFKKAINPNHPEHKTYKDYFLWNEGRRLANGTRQPPSNWLSVFRGSAWTWIESVGAYYLHQFLPEQPDLNYRHQALKDEMKEILRFWLRLGVDGFRVDAIPHLFEIDKNAQGVYDDEPKSGHCQDKPLDSCYLNHIYTTDLNETFDMVYEWRRVMDEPEFANRTRILMTEAYSSLKNTMRYYGRISNGRIVEKGAQIPFNFQLMELGSKSSTREFVEKISGFLQNMPRGEKIQANWVLGNHDKSRISTRFGLQQMDILNILLKTLPGITVTYYGEEIGMTDVWISWKDTVDPAACRTNPKEYYKASRDKVRTPMQWDSTKNAGFSTGNKPWLPVAENYPFNNIALQRMQNVSYFQNFKKLATLRNDPTMKYGGFDLTMPSKDLLIYRRKIVASTAKLYNLNGKQNVFVIMLNRGSSVITVPLNELYKGTLPHQMQVAVASIHSETLIPGKTINTDRIVIAGDVGVVLVGN